MSDKSITLASLHSSGSSQETTEEFFQEQPEVTVEEIEWEKNTFQRFGFFYICDNLVDRLAHLVRWIINHLNFN